MNSTVDELNQIGILIKDKRKKAGLTQEQLAQKAELPYNTLTKIESGVIKNPSSRVVQKLRRH